MAPALYNNLFRRYPGSDLLQIEHLKRLCTRGIVKANIDGGVLVANDVGTIILGQDLQIAYLTPDAAHENFAVSESLVLKIEAAGCDLHDYTRRRGDPVRYGQTQTLIWGLCSSIEFCSGRDGLKVEARFFAPRAIGAAPRGQSLRGKCVDPDLPNERSVIEAHINMTLG